MKPLSIVVAAVLASTSASLGVLWILEPWAPPPGERADAVAGAGDVEPRLRAITERLDRIEARLDAIRDRRRRVPLPGANRAPRAAEARSEDAKPSPARSGAAPSETVFSVASTVELLRSPARSWEEKTEHFKNLTAAQRKEVLAAFEQAVKDRPYSADAHNDLGEAYVQMLMNGSLAEMMLYGQKAEKEFDRALELDDHHWGARFNKAMSLANQPEFLGRRPEAIRQFEILMKQQESSVPEPRHAATYLFLGNLYLQQGKRDRAEEIWKRGLQRFPQSKELKARLKNGSKN